MTTVAFIFARSGSKGIPGKNIRNFGGKPLIAWSIECARSVAEIDEVFVSTDSIEIAEISRKYGASVPFIRPSELATDNSPEWLSWRHALNYLQEHSKLPSVMVSLPATAPLRNSHDVKQCLETYSKEKCDVVITVSEAVRNPYFNIVAENDDGTVDLVLKNSNISRRQEAPKLYEMTTVCYVVNPKFVLMNNSIFEGRVKAVDIPRERAIDLDSMLDFEIAEFLLNLRKEN